MTRNHVTVAQYQICVRTDDLALEVFSVNFVGLDTRNGNALYKMLVAKPNLHEVLLMPFRASSSASLLMLLSQPTRQRYANDCVETDSLAEALCEVCAESVHPRSATTQERGLQDTDESERGHLLALDEEHNSWGSHTQGHTS